MCSAAVASKHCVLKSYRCSLLQLLLQLSMRKLHELGLIVQQVRTCVCVSSNRAKLHVPNICSGHNMVKCTQAVTVSEIMVLFF